MANVSYHIYANLRTKYSDLSLVNVGDAFSLKFWKTIIKFKPDIIHYIPGPSLKSLALVKLIQIITKARSIISATKPDLPKPRYFRLVSGILKPHLVIVQSKKSEDFFKIMKYGTKFIPNGVNIEKFLPVDKEKKKELRHKYEFNEEDFIILHIGPVKNGRNQNSLLQIQNAKILLVVSVTNPSEKVAYQELLKTRAIVWKKYFPNIQEIYAIADIYAFPVFEELNSIEIPLSVLEAMSCNLPVITTRYGALDRILDEGEGLIFIDSPDQIHSSISRLRSDNYIINTRKKIESLSWINIAKEISNAYEEIYQKSDR